MRGKLLVKNTNKPIVFINFIIVSSYIFIIGFLYIDFGSKYLERYSFLQNINLTTLLSLAVTVWLIFLFQYKKVKKNNTGNENELSLFIFVSILFIFLEFTLLRTVNYSILIYILLLIVLLLFSDLKFINLSNYYKPKELNLILLTMTLLCIDVNYTSDALTNTFSFTNFQRTGDYEQYLFLGKFVITDGFLIIYKLITVSTFLLFILYWEKFSQKVKNKFSKHLFKLPLFIVIYECLVTTISQNDYLHNSFTVNEFVGVYKGKLPLINFSSMYNSIFPYINNLFNRNLSIQAISIFISILSIISIFLTLGIIKKNNIKNIENFPLYFVGLIISSTLFSRPLYSMRFLPVLLFFFFLKRLLIKNSLNSKILIICLMLFATLNNFTFGAPLVVAYFACEIVFFYTGSQNFNTLIKKFIFLAAILSLAILFLRFIFGQELITHLISPSISYGESFMQFQTQKKLSFHFLIFPIIFYNLSLILNKLRTEPFENNYLSLFINIYVIGLIPYYFNLQEIYHVLPIILFTYLAVITNNELISKTILKTFLMIAFFLLPRLFVGVTEVVKEYLNNEINISFLDANDYSNNFFEEEIQELNQINNLIDQNEIGYLLDLNNFLQHYSDIGNDTIENVPTSITFNKLCQTDHFQKNKYLFHRKGLKRLENYIVSSGCKNKITVSNLELISNFSVVEINK